ncbi:hypothetical protein J5J10_17740 [Ciceribacter sp. L1K23]|uniref:hypothetical protein n=1 Tax=Ciceribacter sp. L1K23 TaxID=2820276 RepID=UPI001B8458D0|nr:hypothetical protein [Ciceribacter sp. L1K23]MBR0557531.1 hypothetical protein [Ciceribacter sp. L1K23]
MDLATDEQTVSPKEDRGTYNNVVDDPLKRALEHYHQAMSRLDDEEAVLVGTIMQEEAVSRSSFLDAMREFLQPWPEQDEDHLSAVNSDDAGLYRMFINVSP